MIDRWRLERKKTGTPTEREEDGRRRKKGIDIHSGVRKRNGISLLFLQARLMEFQDVADTNGQSLEKFSPDYEALCSYGIITKEAA
jgi:hypothetical protein